MDHTNDTRSFAAGRLDAWSITGAARTASFESGPPIAADAAAWSVQGQEIERSGKQPAPVSLLFLKPSFAV